MQQPNLYRQLPMPLRLFAAYCGFHKRLTHAEFVRGAGRLFAVVAPVAHRLRSGRPLRIKVGGFTVFLNCRDPRFLGVPRDLMRANGPVAAALRMFLSEGDTFLDVGAHYGTISLIASRFIGSAGRLVLVESQRALAPLLARSLRASVRCSFRLHPITAGDRNTTVEFFVPAESSGRAGIFPGYSATGRHQRLEVPMRRLDDAIAWRQLPGRLFMKIDVEGSEHAVLTGAVEMITSRRPVLMLEVNPPALAAAGVSRTALVTLLERLGYAQFAWLADPTARCRTTHMMAHRRGDAILLPS